jgi:arylsulfatase A-like enzyme
MPHLQDDRPSFVVVFMDDMGYGDMGCFGSTAIRTPVMDGVAERGARFTQMYASAAICTPSRCGLLTGRYGQRMGLPRVLFPNDRDGLPDYERTIGERLQSVSYATCCLGKWHLGCLPEHNPTRHGFDHYFGLLYSNDMDPLYLYRNAEAAEFEVDQAALTRRYTEEAIAFIEEHRDEPFFVYLAHTMPHIPLHVEPAFRGRSAGGTYGDTIECIDHYLGVLLDRLAALGLTERTFVVVTSDNGPWYEGSTGGLRGRKFDAYEGGVRMPFVAQWPGTIPAGLEYGGVASLLDLLPTFAGLAGADVSDNGRLDGQDIMPVFLGEPVPPRGALYHFCEDVLCAIRLGPWKLHVAAGGRGDTTEMPQLFNMVRDPGENYNVANRQPAIVADMSNLADSFAAEVRAERAEGRSRRRVPGRSEGVR